MKTRILAILLVVVMVATLVPANVFAAETAPALPKAKATVTGHDVTVTTIDGEQVPATFTMNFKAVQPTEEQFAYYKKWYADYVLTINKDVTGMDGYLVGQYDWYNTNWMKIAVETEDVIIKANEPFKVMYNLASSYDENSTYISYEQIINSVKDFDCGIYFTPEFLRNNLDLKVTLELRIYNLHNMEENYRIGNAHTFTAKEVVANEPVVITSQPSVTVAEDGTATFTFDATGTVVAYQWQRNKAGVWVDASSASYVNNDTTTMSTKVAGTYRCELTDLEGNITYTNEISSEVEVPNESVVITAQPTVSVADDGTATLTFAATGSIKSYQWQRLKSTGWVDATNATSYLDNKTNTMSTKVKSTFRCKITDLEGNVTYTNEVSSDIEAPKVPVDITSQPTATPAGDGTVTFTVVATGSVESYQWERLKSSGWIAASSTSYINSKTSAMTTKVKGTYRCKIVDAQGEVTYTSTVTYP